MSGFWKTHLPTHQVLAGYSRSCDLLRQRKRAADLFDFNRQRPDGENNERREDREEAAVDALVDRQPISDEARVDELIAWARQMPSGFSMPEEEAYRAVVVRGLTEREYAEESRKPPGTVARIVSSAKHKMAAVLQLEWRRFF